MNNSAASENGAYCQNGEKEEHQERGWFQILAIFISCITSFTAGLLFAWTSPSIPRIIQDKVNYDITIDEASYFTVLPSLGSIVTCLLFPKLSDKIGRKYTLLSMAVPQTISMVLIATARSVYVFYAARFISGIGDACLFTVLPVYIGEISTPKMRGSWGNLLTLQIYVGQLFINVVGSYLSISMTAYVCLIFPIFFAIFFMFMPESPYFLLMKNRADDARKTLQRLRRKQNVEAELEQLKADVGRQMSESGTWRDLFTISSNRKALGAGIFLRASQQLGGISCFAVYTQYIFLKAGGALSASTSAIIFMGLCAIFNLCAAYTLDKFGRRRSYFWSCLVCSVILLGEAVYFLIDQLYPEIDLDAVRWIPIFGMILFVFFYSFGLGIIPTQMLGELFSASIKGKGLSCLLVIFMICVSSITKLFQVLETNIGLFAPYLLFSVSCLLSTFLSFYFVPETKGKTLEEIQQSLRSKKLQNDSNYKPS